MSNMIRFLQTRYDDAPIGLDKIEEMASQLYILKKLELSNNETIDPMLELFKPHVDLDGQPLTDNICQDAKSILYSFLDNNAIIDHIFAFGGHVIGVDLIHFHLYVKRMLFVDGLYYISTGEYEKAKAFVDRQIELYPENCVSYYHMATILMGLLAEEKVDDEGKKIELLLVSVFENLEKSVECGFNDLQFFLEDEKFHTLRTVHWERYNNIITLIVNNNPIVNLNEEFGDLRLPQLQFFFSKTDVRRMEQTLNFTR